MRIAPPPELIPGGGAGLDARRGRRARHPCRATGGARFRWSAAARPAGEPGARRPPDACHRARARARAGPQPVAGLAPGSRLVQLGAFDSEASTRAAWSQLVAGNRDLLGDKGLYVERTTNNARVFYRLRVAGFDDIEETRVLCERLRARGIDCIPVTLQ